MRKNEIEILEKLVQKWLKESKSYDEGHMCSMAEGAWCSLSYKTCAEELEKICTSFKGVK